MIADFKAAALILGGTYLAIVLLVALTLALPIAGLAAVAAVVAGITKVALS